MARLFAAKLAAISKLALASGSCGGGKQTSPCELKKTTKPQQGIRIKTIPQKTEALHVRNQPVQHGTDMTVMRARHCVDDERVGSASMVCPQMLQLLPMHFVPVALLLLTVVRGPPAWRTWREARVLGGAFRRLVAAHGVARAPTPSSTRCKRMRGGSAAAERAAPRRSPSRRCRATPTPAPAPRPRGVDNRAAAPPVTMSPSAMERHLLCRSLHAAAPGRWPAGATPPLPHARLDRSPLALMLLMGVPLLSSRAAASRALVARATVRAVLANFARRQIPARIAGVAAVRGRAAVAGAGEGGGPGEPYGTTGFDRHVFFFACLHVGTHGEALNDMHIGLLVRANLPAAALAIAEKAAITTHGLRC